MLAFTIKRIVFIFITMIFISMIIFTIFQFMPGDPALTFMQAREGDMTPEEWQAEYEAVVIMMGLDGPIVYQYYRWMVNMLQGNWGNSFIHRRAVLEVIRVPIMWTVVLSIASMIIGFLLTIPLGIYSAVKRGKTFDHSVMVFSTLGFSMPTFLIAILFIVVFAVYWQVLPITGMISPIPPEGDWAQFLDRLRHMALPLMVLAFANLAGMTRYVRAAMCDALSEDYIRTARSKGLKDKVVIFSHAFRNALVPIVILIIGTIMGVFGGSVVIERTFGWAGMGSVMVDALFAGDYAISKAMMVFYSVIFLLSILLVDLSYGLIDPRIRVSK